MCLCVCVYACPTLTTSTRLISVWLTGNVFISPLALCVCVCVCACICVCVCVCMSHFDYLYKTSSLGLLIMYGVDTISRLLKIIGLFCERALWKRLYSAKETWTFKEPTNRSHPIAWSLLVLYVYLCMYTYLSIYLYKYYIYVFFYYLHKTGQRLTRWQCSLVTIDITCIFTYVYISMYYLYVYKSIYILDYLLKNN